MAKQNILTYQQRLSVAAKKGKQFLEIFEKGLELVKDIVELSDETVVYETKGEDLETIKTTNEPKELTSKILPPPDKPKPSSVVTSVPERMKSSIEFLKKLSPEQRKLYSICNTCNGEGAIFDARAQITTCPSCGGTGVSLKNINNNSLGE
ncbi:MAG: hypothetical protein R3321_04650 [Nitrososphaeraceae archaeon]|nr:hypothetical protein [Nitrososphaeraceae archaeon]